MLVELMCMRTSKALTRANFNLERVDSELFAQHSTILSMKMAA